jgi:hypothetical protein
MKIYEEIALKLEACGLSSPQTQRILQQGIVKDDIELMFNKLELGSFDWLQDTSEFNEVESEIVLDICKVHVLKRILNNNRNVWFQPLFDTPHIKSISLVIKNFRNSDPNREK